jgi:hypothetical protein
VYNSKRKMSFDFCSYLVVDAVVKGCAGNEAYIFVFRKLKHKRGRTTTWASEHSEAHVQLRAR